MVKILKRMRHKKNGFPYIAVYKVLILEIIVFPIRLIHESAEIAVGSVER